MAPATRLNQISDWKKQFLETASSLFEATHKPAQASTEPDVALLDLQQYTGDFLRQPSERCKNKTLVVPGSGNAEVVLFSRMVAKRQF